MKQQTIEELERELDALSPKQARETLASVEADSAKPIDPELAELLDFDKHPIDQDERRGFTASTPEKTIMKIVTDARKILHYLHRTSAQ